MIKSCVTISLVPSLAGGPWIYWDGLEASITKAAAAGFDAVELFPASADGVDAEKLSKLLQHSSITLAALGTGAGRVLNGLSLSDARESVRKKALAYVQEMIALAGRFKAAVIIGSMQGSAQSPATRQQALARLAKTLKLLADTATKQGANLLLEPLNRYETNLVNTLSQGAELIESLAADNVYLLADLFHMNIEEASIPESIRAAAKHIGYVHFVDSNRRPAGLGHIDLAGVGRALRDIGFDGYASAEALPYPDPDRAAAQTIDAFRRFLVPASA